MLWLRLQLLLRLNFHLLFELEAVGERGMHTVAAPYHHLHKAIAPSGVGAEPAESVGRMVNTYAVAQMPPDFFAWNTSRMR